MTFDHPAVTAIFGIGFPIVLALSVVPMAALVVRFRRSAGVERQQIKWTGASTAASSTRPGPSSGSAPASASRSTCPLSAELLAAVDQTVQPTRTSLWLRHAEDARS